MLLVTACVFPQTLSAAAFDGYEATGSVRFLRSPQAGREVSRVFRIICTASNWVITTSESAITPTNFHWKTFNLSSNLLVQAYWNPKTKQTHAQLKPLVAPVSCPDGVSHFVWLTLTPSLQSDDAGHLDLPPVYNPAADLGTNPDLRHVCMVEYLDAARLLPRTIRFFNPGFQNLFSNGTNGTRPFPAPYNKGFVDATFEAVATTNWNGISIPMKVVGKLSRPGGGRSAEDLSVASEIEIVVTSIQTLSPNVQLPPAIEANTIISDLRVPVQTNQPVTYLRHSGPWPGIEASRVELERAKAASKRIARRPPFILIALFVAALLTPPFMLVLRRRPSAK